MWVSKRDTDAINAKCAEIDAEALLVHAAYLAANSKGGKRDSPLEIADETSNLEDVSEAQQLTAPKKKRIRRASAKATAAIYADAVDLVDDDDDLLAVPVVPSVSAHAVAPVVAPIIAAPVVVAPVAAPVVVAPVAAPVVVAPIAAPVVVTAPAVVVDVAKITQQVSEDVTHQIQPKLNEVNDRMSRIEALLLSMGNSQTSSTNSKLHRHQEEEEEEEADSSSEEERREISHHRSKASKSHKRHKKRKRGKSKSNKSDNDVLNTYGDLLLDSLQAKHTIRQLDKKCDQLGAANDLLTTQKVFSVQLQNMRK
jgi:hypothetical protein